MTTESNKESRYKSYLQSEQEAVALYKGMANAEKNPSKAAFFMDLANDEYSHVLFWAEKLSITSDKLPKYKIGFQIRMLIWLAKMFGTTRVMPLLQRIEAQDTDMYSGEPEAIGLIDDEKRMLQGLKDFQTERFRPGKISIGWWDQKILAGSVRAAVLGSNDGLVSNFALVWGVAGGTSDPNIVILAGIAGLVAGSFSMASAEYISMRTHRELTESRIEKVRMELEESPSAMEDGPPVFSKLKGSSNEETNLIIQKMLANPEMSNERVAKEWLGINSTPLGAPWGAAISSFLSFAAGASIPILPYIFMTQTLALSISGLMSVSALFILGTTLSSFSGNSPLLGGVRMTIIGIVAAMVTFGIGTLVRETVIHV